MIYSEPKICATFFLTTRVRVDVDRPPPFRTLANRDPDAFVASLAQLPATCLSIHAEFASLFALS